MSSSMYAIDPSLVHNKETSGRFPSVPPFGGNTAQDSVCPECENQPQIDRKSSRRYTLDQTFQDHLSKSNPEAFEKSIDFYRAVDLEHGKNYRLKVMDCRTTAWFARNQETGQVRVMSRACKLRWCYLCSQAKRTYISHSVSKWIKMGKWRKFMTLTLQHSDDPLASQINKLYSSFQKLKKTKLFKQKVKSGVWFFQVKRSASSNQWHPHLHCIITGLYLPQGQLSKLWKKITHDSKIVDIRMVKDPEKAANEVARYASSPANIVTTHPIDYVTIYDALRNRRIAGTWCLKGIVSLSQPKADDKDKWVDVGSWGVVKHQQGDNGAADSIVKAWATNEPLDDGVTLVVADIERQNGMYDYYASSPIKYKTDLFTDT